MKLTIDGRPIVFEGRSTLLEIARANGIFIPSLCDHPGLEPFAACRLCLVEVKGRKGFVPACSTIAEEGFEVLAATPELTALRRQILELILAEHPHACLICDEKKSCEDYKSTIRKVGEVTGCVLCPANGHCELQRVVEAVGVERVHFPSARREGEVRRDDPLIDRDNSLCILCGRCIRVCREIRGASVLTFVSRGSKTVVGTAMNRRLLDSGCRFCGACVDVCPTGSLAERALRYELPPEAEKQTLCPFCGQGCNLRVGIKDGRVLGSVPDPHGAANRGQACIKGRFLVKSALGHPRRLHRPMIRRDGRLRETTWEEALAVAAGRLTDIGAGRVAVACSGQVSCEDLYVLHKFAAEILKAPAATGPWVGSAAAEISDLGRAAGLSVPLNFHFSDICRASVIVLLGVDLPGRQPIVGVEVNRAVRDGAVLVSIGPKGVFHGGASIKVEIPSGGETRFLSALAAVMLRNNGASAIVAEGIVKFKAGLESFNMAGISAALKIDEKKFIEISRLLETHQPAVFLFGAEFLRTSGGRRGMAALWNLAVLSGGRLIPLDGEANLRGGLEISRAFPVKRVSGTALAMAAAKRDIRALYIAGPVPKIERGAVDLLLVQGSYGDEMTAVADIVLPETTSFESDGTFVNVEGRAQFSKAAIEPLGEARPGWMILNQLAAKMGRAGFAGPSADDIRKELAFAIPAFGNIGRDLNPPEGLFLAEKAARRGAFIDGDAASEADGKVSPAVPKDKDEYKGLNMAQEIKSLKLVRGR